MLFALSAYLPNSVLLLHNGEDIEDFSQILSGTEMNITKIQMLEGVVLPQFFNEGAPQFSHIIILGDASYLNRQQQEQIARFVDGQDDPDFSRSSNFEKETLFFTEKKGIFGKQFEPYPGASLLIASSSEIKFLLNKLGLKQNKLQANIPIFTQNVITQYNITPVTSYRTITQNFKNPNQKLFNIYESSNQVMCGAFRGIQNNARVVYIGTSEIFINANQNIPFTYDIISWFSMRKNLVRVLDWSHESLSTQACIKRLDLSIPSNNKVREGNLVLIKLNVQELQGKVWRAKIFEAYDSFDQMVQTLGFLTLNNSNHTSVMKKQISSFKNNYDFCIRQVLNQSYKYVHLQAEELFIQSQFAVNFVQIQNGTLYALMVPDFSRSYSVSVDLDIDGFNRVNLVQRVHAHVDRVETRKFDIFNSVWSICLFLNAVLAIIAGLILQGEDDKQE
ncbi:hypothetical protein SS50377_20677 [Spironucleus salmonicida]|uniref:Dolichyl-diphosphooligosaccharide--protein glycosyltransferase 48 kDa subunit n=1 Tax=Spironucleus salmonicida TaxID=348837 RepID=V6M0F6_9EUKA|nr:hypothetical protein SS50377_20677 [Spironucleus salmonicida]|eukprot:EST49526.1 hypothetical protein SS50377_10129 [Spironucleus salmonicida]